MASKHILEADGAEDKDKGVQRTTTTTAITTHDSKFVTGSIRKQRRNRGFRVFLVHAGCTLSANAASGMDSLKFGNS